MALASLTDGWWDHAGTTEFLSRAHDGFFHQNEFTVAVGFRTPGTLASNLANIFGKTDKPGAKQGWMLLYNGNASNEQFGLTVHNGTSITSCLSPTGYLTTDTPYNMVGSYKFVSDGGSMMDVYGNGQRLNSVRNAVGPLNPACDVATTIGDSIGHDDDPATGRYYWVAYYKRRLTEAEAIALSSGDFHPGSFNPDYFDEASGMTDPQPATLPTGSTVQFARVGTPTHGGSTTATFDAYTFFYRFGAAPRYAYFSLSSADGASDFVPAGDFSVSMLVRNPAGLGNSRNSYAFQLWEWEINQRCWTVGPYSSDGVRFYISRDGDSSPLSLVSNSLGLSNTEFRLITATYESGGGATNNTMKMWVHSAAVAQTTSAYQVYQGSTASLWIGEDCQWDIAWCAYWDGVVLTEANHDDLRNKVITPESLSPMMLWHGDRLPTTPYVAEVGTGTNAPYPFTAVGNIKKNAVSQQLEEQAQVEPSLDSWRPFASLGTRFVSKTVINRGIIQPSDIDAFSVPQRRFMVPTTINRGVMVASDIDAFSVPQRRFMVPTTVNRGNAAFYEPNPSKLGK